MNEKFNELAEEKQRAVFNAAMEVFGTYDYKKASTDLIAAKAGVSKGLLFYYFHNKKSLYLKTFEYMARVVVESVSDPHLFEITDFFELITYAAEKKVRMMKQNPHIINFSARAFYSEKEDVSDSLKTVITGKISDNYHTYFQHLDRSKFKDGANPERIYNMLVWMVDGYIHMQSMAGQPLDVAEIIREFTEWARMFRKIAYKEEFQ